MKKDINLFIHEKMKREKKKLVKFTLKHGLTR